MPTQKYFDRGDIVEFDMSEPGNHGTELFASQGPFVILRSEPHTDIELCYRVRRLDGKPILDGANVPVSHESFFSWRFREHAFLNSARKAIASEEA